MNHARASLLRETNTALEVIIGAPDYVCILIVLEDTQLFKIISLQVILQIIILKYTGFPKLLREYFLLQ